jgi:hypothetical protein
MPVDSLYNTYVRYIVRVYVRYTARVSVRFREASRILVQW